MLRIRIHYLSNALDNTTDLTQVKTQLVFPCILTNLCINLSLILIIYYDFNIMSDKTDILLTTYI